MYVVAHKKCSNPILAGYESIKDRQISTQSFETIDKAVDFAIKSIEDNSTFEHLGIYHTNNSIYNLSFKMMSEVLFNYDISDIDVIHYPIMHKKFMH